MKLLTHIFKSFTIFCIITGTAEAIAESSNYLKDFKVPMQQIFCMGKSLNGDMNNYRKCMIAIERGAYKCDKVTKPSYDKIIKKYSNYNKNITEYMSSMEPISKTHFECLKTLY